MKKVLFWLTACSFLWGCQKEDATWLASNHRYEITNIIITEPSGTQVDLRNTIFGFADRITFQKFGLGSGSGVISIESSQYETVDLGSYGWFYDYECGCYYYDYNTYRITIQRSFKNEYHFMWHRSGIKYFSLNMSDYDDRIQGTGFQPFWNLLEKKFVVYMDYTLPSKPATAGVVALKDDGIEVILKR